MNPKERLAVLLKEKLAGKGTTPGAGMKPPSLPGTLPSAGMPGLPKIPQIPQPAAIPKAPVAAPQAMSPMVANIAAKLGGPRPIMAANPLKPAVPPVAPAFMALKNKLKPPRM